MRAVQWIRACVLHVRMPALARAGAVAWCVAAKGICMSDWSAGYVADIGYTHGYYTELNPLRVRLAFA